MIDEGVRLRIDSLGRHGEPVSVPTATTRDVHAA